MDYKIVVEEYCLRDIAGRDNAGRDTGGYQPSAHQYQKMQSYLAQG